MSQESKARKKLDPAKTRESIMRGALKVFAEKGYKGASIASIASAAHVRKSLIQYHFGNKEQLWNACLAMKVEPVITAMDRMLEPGGPGLAEIVMMRYKLIRENPDVRRLIAWASLTGVPAPQFMIDRRERVIGRLGHDVRDPHFARFLFALSATDGWLNFRTLYSAVAGTDLLSDEVEENFLKLLSEVTARIE
jgi:TetR/AcrR family transcriptional regulator